MHLETMSFSEKLAILPKLCSTLANLATAMTTGIFRGGKETPGYYRYVAYAAARTLFASTTTKQQQYVPSLISRVVMIGC